MTDVAKGAWDAMLAVGREEALEQKLAQARKNLQSLETSRFRTFLDDDRIKQLRGEIAGLEELDKWQRPRPSLAPTSWRRRARYSGSQRPGQLFESHKGASLAASMEAENAAFKRQQPSSSKTATSIKRR